MITLYVGSLTNEEKNQLREIAEMNFNFSASFYSFDEISFRYIGSFNFARKETLYNLITFKEFVDLFNKSKNKIYECWS